jgi:hypothetical protein
MDSQLHIRCSLPDSEEHKIPVLDLKFDTCMQRGIGEVFYRARLGVGGR